MKYKLILMIFSILILAGIVEATNCWDYSDEINCESNVDCNWQSDA